MSDKIAVLGVGDNAICFDYTEKVVYFFRKGWASKTLKLVDIAIPFSKISAIELMKPETWQSGKIALIVEGNRLLAEDQFENNASELSVGDSMYPALQEAVDKLIAMCPHITLVTTGPGLDVPKTKNQKDYATTVTYKEFISTGAEKPKIVKSGGVSVGTALLILLIGLVCIFLMFKALM